MLKINGLTKKFKKFKAIDSFSFEFNNGIYGLLGPNGAGKTTLLRCISKLYPVDNGVIFYNGQDINENKDRDSNEEQDSEENNYSGCIKI